jgi:hypothetical protein
VINVTRPRKLGLPDERGRSVTTGQRDGTGPVSLSAPTETPTRTMREETQKILWPLDWRAESRGQRRLLLPTRAMLDDPLIDAMWETHDLHPGCGVEE